MPWRWVWWPVVVLLALAVLVVAFVSMPTAEWLFEAYRRLGDYCAYRDQWEGI